MIKNYGNYQTDSFAATQARIPTTSGGTKPAWMLQAVGGGNLQTLVLDWAELVSLHTFLSEVIDAERSPVKVVD